MIIGTLLGMTTFIAGLIFAHSSQLPKDEIALYSNFGAAFILLSIIVAFVTMAAVRKVNVYESFIRE